MADYHLGRLGWHFLSGRVEFETKNTYSLTRFLLPREGNQGLLERIHEATMHGSEAARAVLDEVSVGAARETRTGLFWREIEEEIASDCQSADVRCEDVLARLKFELDGERLKRWPGDSTSD